MLRGAKFIQLLGKVEAERSGESSAAGNTEPWAISAGEHVAGAVEPRADAEFYELDSRKVDFRCRKLW